ncbi:hypothetical protein HK405_001803, partial [Cladochytrium tenue]
LVSPLTWQSTILGLIGIIAGLLIGILGFYAGKPIWFTYGFVDAATLAAIVAWNAEPANGYNTRGALYPVVLGVSGLAGGLLWAFLPEWVPIFAHTGTGSVAILLWLNTLRSGGLVSSGLARGFALALLPVGAGLLAVKADQRFVIPASAASAGVLLTAVGVDSFLRCGYAFGMVASVTTGEVGEALLASYEVSEAQTVLAGLAAGFALVSLTYMLVRDRILRKMPKPPKPDLKLFLLILNLVLLRPSQ